MAGQASTVGSKIGLDAKTGRATQTARTTYAVLLSAAPTDATTLATMAEISNGGTVRASVTWSDPGSGESSSNTNVLTFGPFTTDPASATHVGLVSAASGTSGDFIFWWVLDTARDGAIGDSISFAASALVMTEE
jgi:hypothetical protein